MLFKSSFVRPYCGSARLALQLCGGLGRNSKRAAGARVTPNIYATKSLNKSRTADD
jgi:hypothetical protein